MRAVRPLLLTSLLFAPSATMMIKDPVGPVSKFAGAQDEQLVAVDCGAGETIVEALENNHKAKELEIVVSGTCPGAVLIDRDRVTLRGDGAGAVLVGLVEVQKAVAVTIKDLLIQGSASGGLIASDCTGLTIDNVQVDGGRARVRGIQLNRSTGTIRNVTVKGANAGNFFFRSSGVTFSGTIVASESSFAGMVLQNSTAVAGNVDFLFSRNTFGLAVQINSGFEHTRGHLTAEENMVGIVLAAQSVFAVGSFVEVRDNTSVGLQLDELASMTPLIGAPGGGPTLTVIGNPDVGILVDRMSTLELFGPTLVSGNGTGLQADGSWLKMTSAKILDNTTADVRLSFGTRATFEGTNQIGSPIQCDGTVLARGTAACG